MSARDHLGWDTKVILAQKMLQGFYEEFGSTTEFERNLKQGDTLLYRRGDEGARGSRHPRYRGSQPVPAGIVAQRVLQAMGPDTPESTIKLIATVLGSALPNVWPALWRPGTNNAVYVDKANSLRNRPTLLTAQGNDTRGLEALELA
ncbi:MAG: hypothetical protein R3C68_16430 [Myxococcota bacterium]